MKCALPTSYLLCTAPRSGSTMLCGMLKATGVAGAPASYFHHPDQESWARGLNLPADATLSDIIAAVQATVTEGLFGVRLQQHSFAYLMSALSRYGDTEPERIQNALGTTHYIWLRRQDKLAQAVSVLRAEQSGLWHKNADGSDLERLSPIRNDGYDATAISQKIAEFEAADSVWRTWFADNNLTPWSLTYENLVGDPQAALRMILIHLNRDPGFADHVKIPTQKLADEKSAAWIARYRAEVLANPSESG